MTTLPDEHFMRQALAEAEKALEAGEVPVGAVVECGGRIIGRGHNQTERLRDVTAHAEMIALTAASDHLGGKYLTDCRLFVTLEPCVMCAGACFWAQLGGVAWAADDPKRGFRRSGQLLHPKTVTTTGVLAEEASALLKSFFNQLRS